MEASTQPGQIESLNPATGERLGSVPATDPAEVPRIVADAAEVQPFWAQLRLEDRARYMRRAAQVLIDHLDDMAALVTREHGTPRAEAYSLELVPSVDVLHWLADNGPKHLREVKVPAAQRLSLQRRDVDVLDPLGVVAVVASDDEPWARPFADTAFALMAGNGVVVKPSPLAPLAGQRIQRVFERAGLPDGIVRTVQGGAPVDGVAKAFSAPARGAPTHIVLADANPQHAIDGCLWAGGRAYVARELAERFTDRLVAAAERLRVGDPMSWHTDVGALVSEARYEELSALVDRLVASGATLRCGGPTDPPRFYAPPVLTGGEAADVLRPVVQVIPVESEEEALAGPLGRRVTIWTRDRAKGERMARRISADAVGVNEHVTALGARRLHDYVAVKRIASDPGRTRDFRWYPYEEALGTALRSATQLLYGRDEDKRAALQRGAVPFARLGRKVLGGRPGGRDEP